MAMTQPPPPSQPSDARRALNTAQRCLRRALRWTGFSLSALFGLRTLEQRAFWSAQCGHIGLASVLGGVAILAYHSHKLPDRDGWFAIGCGIVCWRIGVELARSIRQRSPESQ